MYIAYHVYIVIDVYMYTTHMAVVCIPTKYMHIVYTVSSIVMCMQCRGSISSVCDNIDEQEEARNAYIIIYYIIHCILN